MHSHFVLGLVIGIAATGTGALAQTAPPADPVETPAPEIDAAQLCGPTIHDRAVDQVACVKVTVTVEGRATNCAAVISSGDPTLDQLTCEWAEELARFNPALDELGKPVAQDYHMWLKSGPDGKPVAGDPWPSINYRYPARALREGVEGSVGIQVTVGTDGRVKSCKVIVSSGSAHLDQASCDQTIGLGQFDIAVDENGEPAEATYRRMLRWSLS